MIVLEAPVSTMSDAGTLLVLAESADTEALLPKLLAFDRSLKETALNPGTTADLTVATLFAATLQGSEADAI